jgi:hypothetical protein
MRVGFGESELLKNRGNDDEYSGMVANTERRRLEYAIRMYQTRETKKIIKGKPEGRKKVGRHSLRWLGRFRGCFAMR